MLRRLSVFAAGCSLKAAESACSGEGIEGEEVLPLLSSLVTKSLVVAQTLQRTEPRYSLIEAIRQYGNAKHRGEFMGVRPNGKEIELGGMSIARIKDGRIVHRRVVSDWLKVMQELGLVPARQQAP